MRIDDRITLFRVYAFLGPLGFLGLLLIGTGLGFPLVLAIAVAGLGAVVLAPAVYWGIERTSASAAGLFAPGTGIQSISHSHIDALAQQGRTDEALDACRVLAEEYADNPLPHLLAARISRDAKRDVSESIGYFRAAFRTGKDPQAAIAREAIDLLTRADGLGAQGRVFLLDVTRVLDGTELGRRAEDLLNESRGSGSEEADQ